MSIGCNYKLKHQAVGTILCLLGEFMLTVFVDRLGRHWTMAGGSIAMCGAFNITTILLAQVPHSADNIGAHWGFIVMTFWSTV